MPKARICLKFCLIGYCKKLLRWQPREPFDSARCFRVLRHLPTIRSRQRRLERHQSHCSALFTLRPTNLRGKLIAALTLLCRKTLVAHRVRKKRLPQIVTVGLVVYIVTLKCQRYPILPDVQSDEVSLVLLRFVFPAGGGMIPYYGCIVIHDHVGARNIVVTTPVASTLRKSPQLNAMRINIT